LAEALAWAAAVEHEVADFATGRDLAARALAIADAAGDLETRRTPVFMLASVYYRGGDEAAALPLAEEALDISRRLGRRFGEAASLDQVAGILIQSGDLPRACAVAAEALRLRVSLGTEVTHTLPMVAGIAMTLGDSAAYLRLSAAADALRTSGEQPTAFKRAREQFRRQQARHVLGAAAATRAEEEGRRWSQDQAVEYAFAFLSRVPASPAGPGTSLPAHAGDPVPAALPSATRRLSRREQEVAERLAQGLTNREIAAALAITEHTVARHVEHILDKLGMRSRAEVAAWVGRQTTS
jgi:non-specific serine/threonine protein kinase